MRGCVVIDTKRVHTHHAHAPPHYKSMIYKKNYFLCIRTSCRDTDQPREEQLAWQLSLDDPRDKLRRTT